MDLGVARPSYCLTHPDWDFLFEIALPQGGHFTTQQAALAGYSSQLLLHCVQTGKIARIRRGIYRMINYPWTNHEELIGLRLWSNGAGVVSHQTALSLHGLCEPSPTEVHLTLPLSWRRRRLRVPKQVILHHADIPLVDQAFGSPVPVTTPERTLSDCAQAGVALPLLVEALRRAQARGLLPR